MQTQIVARVAEYVRSPDARKSAGTSAATSTYTSTVQDEVVLSSEGLRKSNELQNQTSSWEEARQANLESVKEQVQSDTYDLAPEVVDDIAGKIVDLL
ncbi:MAG TPA: hypothetical protein VLM37_11730 [Fibrobacteraceae bacterium]|nr:hypothetical protein [Fibrobacteraceae bacterium]